MVKLAQQGFCCLLPEHDINDNLLFKMARALADQRAYITASSVTNSSGIGVELLPVEMTLDERPYPVLREVIMKIND